VTNGGPGIARWNGVSWADLSPVVPAGSRVFDLQVLNPEDAWLVYRFPAPPGPAGQLEQSVVLHWNGLGWTEIPLPAEAQPYAWLSKIWSTSASDVWIVGDVVNPGVKQDGILLHWDGSGLAAHSFGPFPSGRQFIFGIWASSPNDVWVAGSTPNVPGGKLSHFDGTGWTESFFAGGVADVWGWCATNVWASANGGMWHYDGRAWSVAPAALSGADISGSGPDDAWASGSDGVTGAFLLHWQTNKCGDEVVGAGEECDPPRPMALGDAPVCDQTCHIPTCGNLVLDPGETCDPPRPMASAGAPVCDQTCHIPTCGNLVLDPGETCDPPDDTTCDRACQNIPIVCGNGIVQPGETCEFAGTGPFCANCTQTACGACFAVRAGGFAACSTLSGAERTNCEALTNCMGQAFGSCTHGGSIFICYCPTGVPADCPSGGLCADLFQSLAGTTDAEAIRAQINDKTTLLGRINVEISTFTRSSCGRTCSGL
jgi:hypothetical protein